MVTDASYGVVSVASTDNCSLRTAGIYYFNFFQMCICWFQCKGHVKDAFMTLKKTGMR